MNIYMGRAPILLGRNAYADLATSMNAVKAKTLATARAIDPSIPNYNPVDLTWSKMMQIKPAVVAPASHLGIIAAAVAGAYFLLK